MRAIVSLVAAMHAPGADAQTLHSFVSIAKGALSGRKALAPTTSIKCFPAQAGDLPRELYNKAYGESAPAPRDVRDMVLLSSRVPLRITNKALQRDGMNTITPSLPMMVPPTPSQGHRLRGRWHKNSSK